MTYLLETCSHSKNKLIAKLDLSNYATWIKWATGINALKFAKKVDLANLKLGID